MKEETIQEPRCKEVTVVFKKDRKSGEVVAVLPGSDGGSLMVPCYTHDGQHSACSIGYLLADVVSARPDEYTDLFSEMESIYGKGVLQIKKRLPDYNKL